ncbi:MAG TPA: DUF3048 domain-containing protein [Armatimonadota bacterium]
MNSQPRRIGVLCGYLAVALGLLLLAGCRWPGQGGESSARNAAAARAEAVCPIDGLPTTARAILRRPLAVMIENSPAARPQSGLTSACVVYEAITEGGITRFLAVFLHNDPPVIGPVRSARPHFINLAREYDAAYVHCGESYEALQILATDPTLYNLDQMKYAKPFWRDRTRHAPHNLYASAAKLRQQESKLLWEGTVSLLPHFASTRRLETGPPATTAEIHFPGATNYHLRLVYDAQAGGYLRYMDGKLHVDRETRKPIVAKNVLIQRVYAAPFTHSTHGTYDVEVIGSGDGLCLSNGRQTALVWQKSDNAALTSYTDQQQRPLPLQPGQTWVEIVPTDGAVIVQ